MFKHNDAPAITIQQLETSYRDLWHNVQTEDKSITINYSNQYKKRDSSYWRDLAFGVGEGERNQALASISGYLLRKICRCRPCIWTSESIGRIMLATVS